jgi:hypothetical protein
MALTVMVMVRPLRPDTPARVALVTGLDVSEYDRHRHRPSTSTPIPMYWPG